MGMEYWVNGYGVLGERIWKVYLMDRWVLVE